MQITIFSKKRTTREGKPFYTYLSRLTKKDGSEVTSSVRFRDTCGTPRPEECPMNIVVEKGDCNFSSKTLVNDATGELIISNTLWVNRWSKGSEYIDTSMDDFM